MSNETSSTIAPGHELQEKGRNHHDQLKYLVTIDEVTKAFNLDGVDLSFIHGDDFPPAKLAGGGIVVNNIVYKLPHTAAIAFARHYDVSIPSQDGWKLWKIKEKTHNAIDFSLAELRDAVVERKMREGIFVSDVVS